MLISWLSGCTGFELFPLCFGFLHCIVSQFNPAIVVMDLGFKIQWPLQEEESFSPSIRFDFVFNLDVCQVSELLLHLITFFFVLRRCLLASLLLCDCTGIVLFPVYFGFFTAMYLFRYRTQRCMIWSLHLNLTMVDPHRVFWNGSLGSCLRLVI